MPRPAGSAIACRSRTIAALILAALLAVAGLPVEGWAQAETLTAFTYQGVERHYTLHKAPNQTDRVPVVVALHGLNQSVEDLRASWTMDAVADREGFAVLYPEAIAGAWAYVDSRPIKLPDGRLVDDLGFILGLLDKLETDAVIDPAHIYVAGPSRGGLMAWTMACAASQRIAAAAPLISGMIERQAELCHPQRLVPLIVIAGTDDWTQTYDGRLLPEYRLMSVPETLEFWRRLRGCVAEKLTNVQPHASNDLTAAVLVEWTECKAPSPQRFFRIEGGGHSLPSFAPFADGERLRHGGRSQAIETAEELWAFFHASAP
jgi:polyhydroxybutyrate depolymerase